MSRSTPGGERASDGDQPPPRRRPAPMSDLNNIVLLGSGVLGGQISFHSAYRGKSVTVYDISADALEACREDHATYAGIYRTDLGATEADLAATQARLTYTTDLAVAVADA